VGTDDSEESYCLQLQTVTVSCNTISKYKHSERLVCLLLCLCYGGIKEKEINKNSEAKEIANDFITDP
jgi:hypothetical protein